MDESKVQMNKGRGFTRNRTSEMGSISLVWTCLSLQVHNLALMKSASPLGVDRIGKAPAEWCRDADEKNGAVVLLGTERRDSGDQSIKNVRQWTRGVLKKQSLKAL